MKILIFWFFSFRTRTSLVKVVSMAQKIEVLKKGLKFCKLHHEKKKKFHGTKKRLFFRYFHYEIIFCCAELFECAFNFKFCQNIFIILNINTNQTSKEQEAEEAASYFLGGAVERYTRSTCFEVNCQTCNSTLQAFLSILFISFLIF